MAGLYRLSLHKKAWELQEPASALGTPLRCWSRG